MKKPCQSGHVPLKMKSHHIIFRHPEATRVFIAGSFNDWGRSTPLAHTGRGIWAVELLLPPGRYEYRFIVDGQWVDDPNAVEATPSPFGGMNGVFVVVE